MPLGQCAVIALLTTHNPTFCLTLSPHKHVKEKRGGFDNTAEEKKHGATNTPSDCVLIGVNALTHSHTQTLIKSQYLQSELFNLAGLCLASAVCQLLLELLLLLLLMPTRQDLRGSSITAGFSCLLSFFSHHKNVKNVTDFAFTLWTGICFNTTKLFCDYLNPNFRMFSCHQQIRAMFLNLNPVSGIISTNICITCTG